MKAQLLLDQSVVEDLTRAIAEARVARPAPPPIERPIAQVLRLVEWKNGTKIYEVMDIVRVETARDGLTVVVR